MLTRRLSQVTVALALLLVVAVLAVRATAARPSMTQPGWTTDPWCFQTGEHYQLCAHGR